ncbi:MAG: tetratricopeptide repeat protein [Anaerolineales bacterium]|nr:tetratricopeptide repeat protein [Anaerolineales bacterium]
MVEKINPYIAGAPVLEARMFFGREDIFSWIKRSLAGKYVDHILVIHGQRRVGKTSVLKHLPNHLPDQYITTFIDLQGRVSTTLDRFLWWLAREITKSLGEHNIELPRPEREAFTQDPETFETQFLPLLEEKLGDKRLLLTFDEFDTLSSTAAQEGLALPFLAILKRMMELEKLNFIFSIGSAGRKLENMQATYTAFFKQALYKKISFLNKRDAHDLITQPVEGVIAYEEQAVETIYKITSGHPYFIQLVCHELFSTCQKTDTWHVSRATVEEVLDAVVERGTVNLKFVWDEASHLEKWALARLAMFEDGTDLPTLEEHLRKERVRFTRQDLEAALVNLRGKDVLVENNRFVIHLMRLWLGQNRSMDQVRDELEEVDPIVSRFLEIGQEYYDTGEYELAIDAFERALEAAPHNLEARLGLGTTRLALGDYGEAANEFETALEISPEDIAAQTGYCNAYMALGDLEVSFNRLEEGEYAFRKVLEVTPKHAGGLKRMAGIHHRRAVQAIIGGEEVALIELEKARRFVPENKLFTVLIDELIALSDGEKTTSDVLLSWGEKALESELWDEAADLFNAYQKSSGDHETVGDLLSEVANKIREIRLDLLQGQAERLTRLERFEEAIEAWEATLALKPPNPEQIQQTLADLRMQVDLLQEASITAAPPEPIWRNLWLWAGLIVVTLLAVWLAQPTSPLRVALAGQTNTATLTPTITLTPSATMEPSPTATSEPTFTPTPAPTPIPLEWRRLNSGSFLKRDIVVSVVIDPTDPDVIYAGMARSGIYKTINGGISWFPAQNGLNRGKVHNLVINPENPAEIYAGTLSDGLFKTEDGGENWHLVEIEPEMGELHYSVSTSYVAINSANPKHMVYTTGNEVLVSLNAGESWNVIEMYPWGPTSIEINPRNGDLIAATTDFQNSVIFVYLSKDGGETWEMVLREDGFAFIGNLYINPFHEEMYYSNQWGSIEDPVNTFRSQDDGRTWELWSAEVTPYFVTSEGVIFGSYVDGLAWTEDNGESWKYEWFGREFDVHAISLSISDTNRIVIGGESLYVSNDGGASWEERRSGLGATTTEIGYGESPDDVYLKEKLPVIGGPGPDMRFFTFNPSNGDAKLVSERRCGEYDPDTGKSDWEIAMCIDFDPFDEGRSVDRTFISPADPNYIYGESNHGPGMYHSTDDGISWDKCAPDVHLEFWLSDAVSSIALHPTDPEIAYFATDNGLLITNDACTNLFVRERLETKHVNSVVVNPENPNIVYVGTDAGVFISYDGAYSWGQVNDGLLGALVVYSLSLDPNNPEDVYATTPYGIFKLEGK